MVVVGGEWEGGRTGEREVDRVRTVAAGPKVAAAVARAMEAAHMRITAIYRTRALSQGSATLARHAIVPPAPTRQTMMGVTQTMGNQPTQGAV